MTKKFYVIGVAVVLVAIAIGPSIGAAQSGVTSQNQTTTAPPTDQTVLQLSPATEVVDHSLRTENDSLVWSITFETDVGTSVTIVEPGRVSGGSGSAPVREYRLDRGTTTVELMLEDSVDDPVLWLSVPESQDRIYYLAEPSSGSGDVYQNWGVALLVGSVGTIFTFAGVKKWRDWRASESIWRVPIND